MTEKTTPLSFGTQPDSLRQLIPKTAPLSIMQGLPAMLGISKFTTHVTISGMGPNDDVLLPNDALEPESTEIIHATSKRVQLKRAYERTSARLAHAVKRLKQKGLYMPSVKAISELVLDDSRPDIQSTVGLLGCLLGGPETKGALWGHEGYDGLTDEEYEKAIELVMFLTEPDTVYSKNMYAPLLDKHIREIYAAVVLIHYATYQKKLLDDEFKDQTRINEAIEEYGGYERALAIISADMAEIKRTAEEKLRLETEKIQTATSERETDLEKRVRTAEKRVKRSETELASAERRISEQSAEIKALRGKIAEMEIALEHRNEQLSGMIAAIPETDAELPDLPDDVLVIGGHQNVIARFRTKYPKWRYIHGHDKKCDDIAQPACVFLLPVDLSHSVQHRALSMISPDTPVIKIDSTNVDRMETDMKKAYANIIPADTSK